MTYLFTNRIDHKQKLQKREKIKLQNVEKPQQQIQITIERKKTPNPKIPSPQTSHIKKLQKK